MIEAGGFCTCEVHFILWRGSHRVVTLEIRLAGDCVVSVMRKPQIRASRATAADCLCQHWNAHDKNF